MRQYVLNPVWTQVIDFHSQIGAMYKNGIVPWGAHPGNLRTYMYKQINGQKSENIAAYYLNFECVFHNALRIETDYGLYSIEGESAGSVTRIIYAVDELHQVVPQWHYCLLCTCRKGLQEFIAQRLSIPTTPSQCTKLAKPPMLHWIMNRIYLLFHNDM